MAPSVPDRNPFMLMLHPEVVLAAVEKSERLAQLNRRLCRPLDRLTPAKAAPLAAGVGDDASDGAENDEDEPVTTP